MRTQRTSASAPRRPLGDKLAVAAGSGAAAAALAAVPAVAQATILSALGAPISPPAANGTTDWDVDGDGTVDFGLRDISTTAAFLDDRNGGRLVVPTTVTGDGIAKLALSFMVGPTLASGYKFWAGAQSLNAITSYGGIGVRAFNSGWSLGDTGFFGFKFTSVDGTHFGWGTLDITGSPAGSGFSILNAYYESTPGTAIHVGSTGAVPEPSSLALLALGAAGLPALRRRRKTADAATG